MNNLPQFVKAFLERSLSIVAYISPFIEVTVYFANRVCYSSNDIGLKILYAKHLYPIMVFYEKNVYLIFGLMVGIFLVCARNTVPLTKFLRFNVLQAILMDIICACIGQIYMAFPTAFKLSIFGVMFAKFVFLGTICWIIYSMFIISLGRFPVLPVVSKAANIHLQR